MATQSQRFCGHNAITRGSRDAVMTVATQSRHGDDAVTTRFVVTTRSRQGHDRITTRSRRSHDRVTTGSRRGHDAVTTRFVVTTQSRSRRGHDAVATRFVVTTRSRQGHDRVTTRSRSRRGHDAFCGHDAVTTGSRQGRDAVTTRSSETQSPQSQLRARILRFHSRRISQKNHANK